MVLIFSALRGSIPAFINISDGKMQEVKVFDFLPTEPSIFYIIGRGYLDCERVFAMNLIRAKTNMNAQSVYSLCTDLIPGVIFDQSAKLNDFYAAQHNLESSRRIRFKNP